MQTILITGGCGYIGSHTVVNLLEKGFRLISIDNFIRSRPKVIDQIRQVTGKSFENRPIDLCDRIKLFETIESIGSIDGIIHFAALKYVPESVQDPLIYYQNNLISLWNLLEAVKKFNIPSFLFSSSCSVYGDSDALPVTESTPLGKALSPYAYTKQIGEQMITDFITSGSPLKSLLLRYFNPVGAHPSGLLGEWPLYPPMNLLPIICEAASGIRKELNVFGTDYPTRDGSCIRDYIHVCDIAEAHAAGMEWLIDQSETGFAEVVNLGTGNGVSVLEAISSFEKVTGVRLPVNYAARRPGDVPAIYANIDKAHHLLHWRPQYSLDEMMSTAWIWHLNWMKDSSTSY